MTISALAKFKALIEDESETQKVKVYFTLTRVLEFVANELAINLVSRKNSMSFSRAAMLAKAGHLFPGAYKTRQPSSEEEVMFHHHHFIQDHLYYLINPVVNGKDVFVTMKASGKNPDLQICRRIKPDRPTAEVIDWLNYYTRFYADNFFSIIGSLAVKFTSPVFQIFPELLFGYKSSPAGLANAASSASGISIVDASQHSSENRLLSFSGQHGVTFVANVLVNCLKIKNMPQLPITCTFEDANLKAWLKCITLPFLYSLNVTNNAFDHWARHDSSAFMSSYTRTKDYSQVDGLFKFKHNALEGQEFLQGAVEFKTFNNEFDVGELENVLIRSTKAKAKLTLVFCKRYKLPERNSKAVQQCQDGKINIYRAETVSFPYTFKICQYSSLMPLNPYGVRNEEKENECRLTVIVFSIDDLNLLPMIDEKELTPMDID